MDSESEVDQLHSRAQALFAKFMQGDGTSLICEAIVLDREALKHRPPGHSKRSVSLTWLALHLWHQYNQLGVMSDLEEAICLAREAFTLCPKGDLYQSMSLNNLALCLSSRYDQFGAMQDLEEAIILDREALELHPHGHHLRPVSLNNLALRLSTRYNQLGAIQDLDEAIVLDREALKLRPQGHADRSMSLNNLAVRLASRYTQLGVMQDLNEAISLDREALKLRPQGHPHRSIPLVNLAADLSTRYNQLHDVHDLDEAIVLDQEALQLHPPGHPNRSASLISLAVRLSTRFNQLGTTQDLSDTIDLDREAVRLRPQGHPGRSMSLNNLAVHLLARFNHFGATQDLDEAIDLNRDALALCPQGHPDHPVSLNHLALSLRVRFTQSSQFSDKEELFSVYSKLVNMPQIVSSSDLSAARAWVRACEDFQHPMTVLAYETSLQMLVQHLATLPSLPQHLAILKNHSSSLAVDAFSACLRSHAPSRAVELLEQGRSVFWGQLIRLRSPLEVVIASGPTGNILADQFMHLTKEIRGALSSPDTDQHERLCHLNLELHRVVGHIRELPGLSCFLLPSLFADLQHAASQGPVIIVNASQYSCDALVVFFDRDPVHIPLQTTREDVREFSTELRTLTERATKMDMTRQFASFLRKLWDEFVSIIIDFLQTVLPLHSRIWWCPTAEFSLLPLHAAGPFKKGQRNLPHLYVSSYTPTLNALIRARRPAPSNPDIATSGTHFLAVGQANAIGVRELPSVSSELVNVGHCVDKLATFTRIEGQASCISRVAEELNKNQWVHLACHGLPNQAKPFESAFALRDGRFTIERIIQCELEDPEFAYLSACHTTVGYEESPDEVIHLASAMQFVGFRSVIGTMWAVDDGETNKITSMFYRYVVDEAGRLDHTRAAYALNKTMRTASVPLDQRILYIHLGA